MGIFSLRPIEFLKRLNCRFVKEKHGISFLQLAQPSRDGRTIFVGQLRQFSDNFCGAHAGNLATAHKEGNTAIQIDCCAA